MEANLLKYIYIFFFLEKFVISEVLFAEGESSTVTSHPAEVTLSIDVALKFKLKIIFKKSFICSITSVYLFEIF